MYRYEKVYEIFGHVSDLSWRKTVSNEMLKVDGLPRPQRTINLRIFRTRQPSSLSRLTLLVWTLIDFFFFFLRSRWWPVSIPLTRAVAFQCTQKCRVGVKLCCLRRIWKGNAQETGLFRLWLYICVGFPRKMFCAMSNLYGRVGRYLSWLLVIFFNPL